MDDNGAHALGAAEGSRADSGCQVDWSWLVGLEIQEASSSLDRLVLRLSNGQTLTVRAALWQGQAFLAFDPWRAR